MYIGYIKKETADSLNTTISDSPSSNTYTHPPLYSTQTLLRNKTIKTPISFVDSREEATHTKQHHYRILLDVEQLKRQNALLKQKLQQMGVGLDKDQSKTNFLIETGKGQPSKKQDSVAFSVSSLLEEISNLLNTIVKLFHGDLTTIEIQKFNALEQTIDDGYQITPFKDQQLKESLDKIATEEQSRRFDKLIDLFAFYYKTKEDCDKNLAKIINKIINKANQLNKQLKHRQTPSDLGNSTGALTRQESFEMNVGKQTPFTPKIHRRNKSSLTPVDIPKGEFKFFRRTNKQPS